MLREDALDVAVTGIGGDEEHRPFRPRDGLSMRHEIATSAGQAGEDGMTTKQCHRT
jgi:hypothetical protein